MHVFNIGETRTLIIPLEPLLKCPQLLLSYIYLTSSCLCHKSRTDDSEQMCITAVMHLSKAIVWLTAFAILILSISTVILINNYREQLSRRSYSNKNNHTLN